MFYCTVTLTLQMTTTASFSKLRERTDYPDAVAAVEILTQTLRDSTESTLQGLLLEVRRAADEIKAFARVSPDLAIISLESSIDVFLLYVTRQASRRDNFRGLHGAIVERAEKFVALYLASREKIAHVGAQFIRDGCTILVHGYSRVVVHLLTQRAKTANFSVLVTEGRPVGAGRSVAEALRASGISCDTILDAAVGYMMGKVDMCLVGAEGVVESGGVVNLLGTYQLAIVAQACKIPLYVATETFKFARLYPLSQDDLPQRYLEVTLGEDAAAGPVAPVAVTGVGAPGWERSLVKSPVCDYTPPEYITLMFTDVGVLTPSAVSDELIKLYT